MRGTEGCNWGAIGRVHALVYGSDSTAGSSSIFLYTTTPTTPTSSPSSPTSPTTTTTPILRGRVIRQSGYGIAAAGFENIMVEAKPPCGVVAGGVGRVFVDAEAPEGDIDVASVDDVFAAVASV